MEFITLYILKVNIAFTVFYLLYKSFFNTDTFFGLRRVILLLFYVIAWVYPFINLSSEFTLNIIPFNSSIYPGIIPELFSTSPDGVYEDIVYLSSSLFSWENIIIFIYSIGLLVMLFRTLLELYLISRKLINSYPASLNGLQIRVNNGPDQPYSFFKWIFISTNLYKEKNERLKEILIHEKAHTEQYHSVDILLAQFTIILCWFNPFVWLLRREIRLNHEYLADRKVVLSGINKKSYQYHLIGMQENFQLAAANLYNNFSILPLKKRIKMLNRKQTSNIMKSKYLIFFPVVAFLILYSNSQVSVAKELISEIPEIVNMIKPDTGKEADQTPEDEIYELVEEMPDFPGGPTALVKFISENIVYPDNAQKNGIQGRVILTMVVEKDGSLSNIVVARSNDKELDEEAIRVLKSMPKWIPGKQNGENVRVKYTIPVMFRLQ